MGCADSFVVPTKGSGGLGIWGDMSFGQGVGFASLLPLISAFRCWDYGLRMCLGLGFNGSGLHGFSAASGHGTRVSESLGRFRV